MEPTISVIVPIYNMETYLGRCLDSLLAQRFANLEIIAINDGSTDCSLPILRDYAQRDSRIIVIDKPNGGVSAARNAGLREARGTYIGFVDPDDWVDASMYETLHGLATEQDADIVMCGYVREFGTHAKIKNFPGPELTVYRGEDVQRKMTRRLVGPLAEELANPEYLDAWGTIWNKLYRASLIRENGLSFVDLDVIGSNEDSLFNIYAYHHAKCTAFVNRPYYHYWRMNADSITTRHNPALETKFGKLYNHMEQYLEQYGLPEQYRHALHNRIGMNAMGLGLNLLNPGNPATRFGQVKQLKELLASPRMVSAFERFETRYCAPIWRLFYLCAKYRFATGLYMLLLAINWMRFRNARSVRVGAGSNITGSDRDEPRRIRNDDHELLSQDGSKPHSI